MKGTNPDFLTDFIENTDIKAEKAYWNIQYAIDKRIPIIDYNEILQHLKDMTFDPVTGNFILYVREFKQKDANSPDKTKTLTRFFIDAFIGNTKDPGFLSLKDNKNKYDYAIKYFSDYYTSLFKKDDGNLTILVAYNKKNKLCGAIVTNTLSECGIQDTSTCYVDSIAVASEYQRLGIGQLLMDKAISCSKDIYTDVFLASDNMAVPFELKNGFRA